MISNRTVHEIGTLGRSPVRLPSHSFSLILDFSQVWCSISSEVSDVASILAANAYVNVPIEIEEHTLSAKQIEDLLKKAKFNKGKIQEYLMKAKGICIFCLMSPKSFQFVVSNRSLIHFEYAEGNFVVLPWFCRCCPKS